MKRVIVVVGLLAAVAVAGCESMGTAAQSKTNQGAVLGGLLGAGTGAILGNQMGHHAGVGTAIGAGLGALGGGMIGHGMEEQSQAAQRQTFPPASQTTGVSTATAGTRVKFCPIGGETYPESMKYCPIHGVELKYKDAGASSAPDASAAASQTTQ